MKLAIVLLYLFFLTSCVNDWAPSEKQKFMDDCLIQGHTKQICDCEYEIAIYNLTFEEYSAVLNQKADKNTRDIVNRIRKDFDECKD